MAANLDSLFGDDSGEDPESLPVALSDDLARILRLPQRDAMSLAEQIAEPLSRRLSRPDGAMALRPLQALALCEAHDLQGLLALLPVGEGKTLVTFLLPVVIKCERPLLVIPAALHQKTERDFAELGKHWYARPMQIVSYELISRRPELLDEIKPDLIVCDEVDALKNPKAACTRRMHRYIRDRKKAGEPLVFCGLSGTIANRSFKDWWHIQQWALPPLVQPLPYSYPVMQSWSQALDEKLVARRPTGQLWRLVSDVPHASVADIREAFGKRLRRTPGIITADGSTVSASLRIDRVNLRVPEIERALADMRRTWCTPGGEEFSEAADLWRHAREIANGFYYRWEPTPPKWWLEPRKDFHAFVRSILGRSRSIDTMAQVVATYPEESSILNWYAVKDGYTPTTVPVWLTDVVLEYAARWAYANDGLVWMEHRAVGERLTRSGLRYFGEQGQNEYGHSIQDHTGPAAVSALACYRGFNLQAWSRNLIMNAPPVGKHYEQLLGRTHRFGQLADAVTCTLLLTADEQRDGFEQACADAEYIQQTTGQRQKLCFADYI